MTLALVAPKLRAALATRGTAPRSLVDDAHWQALEAAGLALERRGDQMHLRTAPLDWVHGDTLAQSLVDDGPLPVRDVHVAFTVDSTNAWALAAPRPPDGACDVWFSDHQSAGRGRREHRWLSPFASGLCLTVSTVLAKRDDLGALPLALGLGVRQALMDLGVPDVLVKWPNDLVIGSRKLGGILVESRYMAGTDPVFVMGVGVNVSAAPTGVAAGGLEPIALHTVLGERTPARQTVAAAIVWQWRSVIARFALEGFNGFAAQWRAADCLRGRHVAVGEPTRLTGTACGVDANGQLRLATEQGEATVPCGAVHVRFDGRAA